MKDQVSVIGFKDHLELTRSALNPTESNLKLVESNHLPDLTV